jgi:stress response protein YsnF
LEDENPLKAITTYTIQSIRKQMYPKSAYYTVPLVVTKHKIQHLKVSITKDINQNGTQNILPVLCEFIENNMILYSKGVVKKIN